MGNDDGFATFISDDLPGFNSLNGSGFFDQIGDWNDMDSDDDHSSSNDGFRVDEEEDLFAVVRSHKSAGDVLFFESGDEEDDDEEEDDMSKSSPAQLQVTKKSSTGSRRRSSTVKKGDKPTRPPAPSSDGKRKMRRSKTIDERSDSKSVGSRGAMPAMRRVKTSDGTTRKMTRPQKRSENLKKKGQSLQAQLNKLNKDRSMKDESQASVQGGRRMRRRSSQRDLGNDEVSVQSRGVESQASAQGGRRMRRRSSQRDLGNDEVSVQSRGVQSCAAASVGRRDSRRRRATQSHALLARNLQQYAPKNDVPVKESSSVAGKEEVWRARRRRSVGATTLPPAIAA